MIIQNNTVIISPDRSSSSASSSASNYSADSDWLEVKMETEDSPDTDRSSSAAGMSPDTSLHPSPTPVTTLTPTLVTTPTPILVITPPSDFADTPEIQTLRQSSGHRQTPNAFATTEWRGHRATGAPLHCVPAGAWRREAPQVVKLEPGRVFTFKTEPRSPETSLGSIVLRPGQDDSSQDETTSTLRSQPSPKREPDSEPDSSVSFPYPDPPVSFSYPSPPHLSPLPSTKSASSVFSTTSTTSGFSSSSSPPRADRDPRQKTPSSARTTDVTMGNADDASPRTPSMLMADFTLGHSDKSSERTPSMLMTDFTLGNAAAEYSSQRTPTLLITDSIMGNSTFAERTHITNSSAQRTPTIVATDSVMGSSPFAERDQLSDRTPRSQRPSVQTTPSILVSDSVMGKSSFSMRTPVSERVLLPQRTPLYQRTPLSQHTPLSQSNPLCQSKPLSQHAHLSQSNPLCQSKAQPQHTPLSQSNPLCQSKAQPQHTRLSQSNPLYQRLSVNSPPSVLATHSNTDAGNSTFTVPRSPTHRQSPAGQRTSPGVLTPRGSNSSSRTPLSELPPQSNFNFACPWPVSEHASGRGGASLRTPGGLSSPMQETQAPTPPDRARSTQDDLQNCQEYVDSLRQRDWQLKEELVSLRGQFLGLLDHLGLSHDVYYNARTPDTTARSSHLSLSTSASVSLHLGHGRKVGNSALLSSGVGGGASRPCGMNTPRSTPRRGPSGRRALNGSARTSYADLLIEQLLAKAQTDSSDTSNSPPDPEEVAAATPQAGGSRAPACGERRGGGVCAAAGVCSVRTDNGTNVDHSEDDEEDDFESENLPALAAGCTVSAAVHEEQDSLLQRIVSRSQAACDGDSRGPLPHAVLPSRNDSSSSSTTAPSCSSLSSGANLPDLDKELVSRIQYYSDFTIDRQKKIDQAVGIPEENDENSPPAVSEHSSDSFSHRCVEGSESVDHFAMPRPPSVQQSKPLLPGSPRKRARSGKRIQQDSSDLCESDTSSGTGSMPASQQSSRPPSCPASKHSSRSSSRHSSLRGRQSRQSGQSSSGDRRSSSRSSKGSRGSRCSTHPLASSTFIADPSHSGSGRSGSVYTWSLDNSSDESLHRSFLRSERRRTKRKSRADRHGASAAPRSSASPSPQHPTHSQLSLHSNTASRPATLIGADSPPLLGQASGDDATLHLTHMISVIDAPDVSQFAGGGRDRERYGGRGQASMSSPRSASLPRTSTKLGSLLYPLTPTLTPGGESSSQHKASSVPELSRLDMNCALSRIGPSNLSSELHHTGGTTDQSTSPLLERPELPGKSSTSESVTSYLSQCSACNPQPLVVSPAATSIQMAVDQNGDSDDDADDILTNSARSYCSSGLHPPYNSYTSPAGSTNEYTTVSESSAEQSCIVTSAPRPPRAFAVKGGDCGVFKVPFSPAGRSVKRKAGVGNVSTHSVGVRTVSTPHLPLGLVKHNTKELVSRRKLFGAPTAQVQQAQAAGGNFRAPKILDRKALVRKFKKFSTNFKRDKDGAKIQTLANL